MKKIIPLSVPQISGNEWEYVKDCLETGWISSVGSYVDKFENEVADFVGSGFCVATVNGTAALHVGLMLLGVKRGDYVLMPNLTFVATANAVSYVGAEPILVDAEQDTWQLDLGLLESFLRSETAFDNDGCLIYKNNGRTIRVLIPVHVQGNILDMDRLQTLCQEFNLPILEDAAESLGSTYKGRHAGTFGSLGCLSFNGNKIISTGGGGMIITDNEMFARRAKHLTTTAKTDPTHYFHDEIGYNYRLVNILAAVGVAQMELLEKFIDRKKEIAKFYETRLSLVGDIQFQKVSPEVEHNHWLVTIRTSRQSDLLDYLSERGITCRPMWMPMNKLPMYSDCVFVSNEDNSSAIQNSCLAIPCSSNISNQELETVALGIEAFFKN